MFFAKHYTEEEVTAISATAQKRFDELCLENADESERMYIHTRQRIYPAIASFDAQIAHNKSREEATSLILEYYSWRSNIMGQKINKIMKFPFLYKTVPSVCRTKMKKMFSKEFGFESNFYESPKTKVRFDMTSCPYADICKKYGCPEIVIAFCNADDISFGNIHKKVEFSRSKTLANGDDCCNFSIELVK